jgi:hypothetical protein
VGAVILADESLHRADTASLGQPVLSDVQYAEMVKDIRF